MKEIPLTQGKIAIVDDNDYELLCNYKWHVKKRQVQKTKNVCYAVRCTSRKLDASKKPGRPGRQKTIWMHRIIIDTPEGFQTDHIDGDGLNNQKVNLRVVTQRENQQNQKNRKNKSSKYYGVSYDNDKKFRAKRWRATIAINKKYITIGRFATEEEAHQAYLKKLEDVHD